MALAYGEDGNMSGSDEYRRAAELMEAYVLENDFSFPYEEGRIQAVRNEFLGHYAPERLRNLADNDLLETLFYNAFNRNDGLWYFLEMNKECRQIYGSIAGGSAYKFGLFQKKEDGLWYSGSAKRPQILEEKEALELGKQIRDGLVRAAEYMEGAELNSEADYEILDDKIREILGERFCGLVWIHKYLSMLFPEKLSGWHNTDWQKHILYALGIQPNKKYYARSGQIAMVCRYTGWQYPQFAPLCRERFGGIRQFVRLGTSDNDGNYADEWRTNDCVGIGWGELGDLRQYVSTNGIDKNVIAKRLLNLYYPNNKQLSSRKAGELAEFYQTNKNTVFVLMDGNTLLGLVDHVGEYFYEEGLPMPHLKHGTWHNCFTKDERLPEKQEGHMTSCYGLKDEKNLLYLYEKYYYDQSDQEEQEKRKIMTQETAADLTSYIEPEYYTGFETDFERNRILFGAPGTGKSYRLNQEAEELIGCAKGHMERVTFHPDYSHSQFVGAYKPVTDTNGDIRYDFVPGPFMRVYVDAVRNSQQIQRVYKQIEQAQVMYLFPTNPCPSDGEEPWDLFEQVTETGQQETFRAPQNAEVGDLALIYVADSKPGYMNGIYAIGTIVEKQGEHEVTIRFDYVSYFYPIIDYETLKDYRPNIQRSNRVKEEIRQLIKECILPPNPYVLVIEEINRARAAAVFGDVFQLLDRDEDGVSVYDIQTSEDVRRYLASELGGESKDWASIRIPDNMFLWSTMNSADQGVFPMDTAFKRRWEFEYLGIDDGETDMENGTIVLGEGNHALEIQWNQLRKAINEKLADEHVNEDKLLGPFFLSGKTTRTDEDGRIAEPKRFIKAFKSKVLMYLYEDAARQHRRTLFSGCDNSRYSKVCEAFDCMGIDIFGDGFRTLYDQQEG